MSNKNDASLPVNRIKKIVKSDDEIHQISSDGCKTLTKATELFMEYFSVEARKIAESNNRTNITYDDFAETVNQKNEFGFLREYIPKRVNISGEKYAPINLEELTGVNQKEKLVLMKRKKNNEDVDEAEKSHSKHSKKMKTESGEASKEPEKFRNVTWVDDHYELETKYVGEKFFILLRLEDLENNDTGIFADWEKSHPRLAKKLRSNEQIS